MLNIPQIPEFGECKVSYDEYFLNTASDFDIIEELEKIQLTEAIYVALETLNERERFIIIGRFFESRSFKLLAAELGISAGRAGQIEAKALRKLRHPFRSSRLEPFLYDDDVIRERIKKEQEQKEQYRRECEEIQRLADIEYKHTIGCKDYIELTMVMDSVYAFRRAVYFKNGPQELYEKASWWASGLNKIRQTVDDRMPEKKYYGKCECREATYQLHSSLSEFEALCPCCYSIFKFTEIKKEND